LLCVTPNPNIAMTRRRRTTAKVLSSEGLRFAHRGPRRVLGDEQAANDLDEDRGEELLAPQQRVAAKAEDRRHVGGSLAVHRMAFRLVRSRALVIA
jgi:hypothetical protein